MGISLGGARVGTIAEMNVVPLIDILLVLLVIFMVIRPSAEFGLPVDLPEQMATPAPSARGCDCGSDSAAMALCGLTRIQCNGQSFTARLAEIFKMRASRVAFVRGDRILEFGMVARAIDVMRGSGITTVGLITSELANAR